MQICHIRIFSDPDDADLSSGRYQYVLPYVRREDIVNLDEVLREYPGLQNVGTSGVRIGEIGMKLSSGEVVTTVTGRQTTPFPKIDTYSERKIVNTLKRVDRDKPSQPDKDGTEMYLFG